MEAIVLGVVTETRVSNATKEDAAEGVDVFSDSILSVFYVLTIFVPTNGFLFSFLLTVNWNLHPVIKKTVWLWKIKYIEFYRSVRSCICNSKIEPLCVSLSVDIILH